MSIFSSQALPLVALVGRTNVGKSSLFNALLEQRRALVDNHHGLTRDYLIETLSLDQEQSCCLVDTGGLDREHSTDPIDALFLEHTWKFLEAVDVITFVIDASVGLLDKDLWIFEKIHQLGPKVIVIFHKSDDDQDHHYQMLKGRFKNYLCQRTSIHEPSTLLSFKELLSELLYPVEKDASDESEASEFEYVEEHLHEEDKESEEAPSLSLAQQELLNSFGIFGRPNAGKSSLVNALTRKPSALVSPIAGTTRDYTRHIFSYQNRQFCLFDTAGIVPKAHKHPEQLERMTYYKTLIALKHISTAVFVIDAQVGLSKHDMQILSLLEQYRRGLVIVVNKWDLLSSSEQSLLKQNLEYELKAFHYAPMIMISALEKRGLGEMMKAVSAVMDSFCCDATTSQLNRILEKLIEHHQPPLVGRHRIKPRFVHKSDVYPLGITIHGNQLDQIPNHYHRYLLKGFAKELDMVGIPLKIAYKNTKNPYAPVSS